MSAKFKRGDMVTFTRLGIERVGKVKDIQVVKADFILYELEGGGIYSESKLSLLQEYTAREERIAIKMDSHIEENEAIRQTDEELETQQGLFT